MIFTSVVSTLKVILLSLMVRFFAFEDELLVALVTINYVWKYGWRQIWLERDSSYVVQSLSCRSKQVPWLVRQAWQWCIY